MAVVVVVAVVAVVSMVTLLSNYIDDIIAVDSCHKEHNCHDGKMNKGLHLRGSGEWHSCCYNTANDEWLKG